MTTDQVTSKFDKLSNAKKVEVLFDAIGYMQQYNGRTISTCICLAMGYEEDYDKNGNFIWEKRKSN